METLNLLANGNIYKLTYDDIKKVIKNHSRVTRKRDKANKILVSPSSSLITKNEIGVGNIERGVNQHSLEISTFKSFSEN